MVRHRHRDRLQRRAQGMVRHVAGDRERPVRTPCRLGQRLDEVVVAG
jgi:hypothetical protein